MDLIDPTLLGVGILLLMALLVGAKWAATGSLLERPEGSGVVWLANLYNLGFLLIANPSAALYLIFGQGWMWVPTQAARLDPTRVAIAEGGGLALYLLGAGLMLWALVSLGRRYQLGGAAPRRTDALVVSGPYRLVRHPLYAAVLCLSLGLAGLLHSVVFLVVFAGYGVLIGLMIPREEAGLDHAYGAAYDAYRRQVKAVVPFLL